MSSTQYSSAVSSRRPSLATLYNNLKAQSDTYEELENAARLFPIEDEEEETYTVPSISSSPSPPPPFAKDDEEDSNSESDSSDEDSDVEPMDLSSDAYELDSVLIHDDAPFMPQRQASPEITRLRAVELPAKPVRVAPSPSPAPTSHRPPQRKRARLSVANEGSDREADAESTGDTTDDEYMPSPSLHPRKRTRTSSPAPFRRKATSPTASSSFTHSTKRTGRVLPQSRNIQASRADIQRVENSEDLNDFVCTVCGWVQKNERIPDFKRHLKTHQRAFEENSEKGWRCKGVLVSEAADYGLGEDAATYIFLNRERIGGCMKTFSRRDALKRHLDNVNVSCVGRPTAATDL